MSKIIVVANQKGGVGKTMITYNLAHRIAQEDTKLLIVDLDRKGDLSFMCKLLTPVKLSTFKLPYHVRILKNMDIMPYTKATLEVEDEIRDLTEESKGEKNWVMETLLRKMLEVYNFDYIICDTPPVLNRITQQVMECADLLLVPAVPDKLSINGLMEMESIVATVKNKNPELKHSIILNKFVKDQDASEMAARQLGAYDNYAKITIPLHEYFDECLNELKPAIDNSQINEVFTTLFKHIDEK